MIARPIIVDGVDTVIRTPVRDLGGGFHVRRPLPSAHRGMIGPFILLDHMGPATLAAGDGFDVRPHPHIGLATVTYLVEGEMMHRGEKVDPGAIRSVALFTVEGENDDISGVGQTQAAHDLCVNIPREMRAHYLQPAVGHYGVFNGSRFRSEIVPRILDFQASYGRTGKRPKPRLVHAAKA